MTPGDTTLVILPFGRCDFLALSPEELAEARDRALAVLGLGWQGDRAAAPPTQSPELLTAEEMEERTTVKAAWYLEAARQGRIPHHRIGRYVRFDLAEVRDCTRYRGREAQGAGGKVS